jgi:hypothetical protein
MIGARKVVFFFMLCTGITHLLRAQTGGINTFQSLALPGHTLTSALGGKQVSNFAVNPNTFFDNPALLTNEMAWQPSFNYSFWVDDIGLAQLVMPFEYKKTGLWSVGMRYFNYGSFKGYDNLGQYTGDFSANDFALTIAKSHKAGPFTLGANVHFAFGNLADYRASATLFDVGGVYQFPGKDWTIGLTLKNLGWFWSNDSSEPGELPFDVQLGTTFKPKYMPFRFTFTVYDIKNIGESSIYNHQTGNLEEANGFDRVFSHITIGTELIINQNINARLGYNHRIRNELRLTETASGAGFTYGLMIRIKTIELSYTYFQYHAAGANNQIGLTVDLNNIVQRKTLEVYEQSGIE